MADESVTKLRKHSKSFTLIELLVVITIIGCLSSIIMVSVNSAREKARIGKVYSDFASYRLALDLYVSDNGAFPCLNEGSVSSCLTPALASYGTLPTQDPWGSSYIFHNPGCCVTECVMILSRGPDKFFCGSGSDYNCEHSMPQTANCTKPAAGDDIGLYFGQVRDRQ